MKKTSTLNCAVFIFLLAYVIPSRAQWKIQNSGFKTASRFPFTLSIVNKDIVWAASVDAVKTFNSPAQEFSKTTNGGKTWIAGKVTDLTTLRSSCIVAIDANTAWISMNDFTKGSDGGIFKTADGGVTWQKQTTAFSGMGVYISFIHFFDRNNGIAVGNSRDAKLFESYTTTDGGENWKPLVINVAPKEVQDKVFDRCYATQGNTIWFGTENGRVYKSTDKGYSWSVSTAIVNEEKPVIHGITFRDKNSGMVVFYDGIIAKTSDGGKVWLRVQAPAKPSTAYITSVPGTDAYVITAPSGFGFKPGSAFTLDEGTTWTVLDSLPHQRATFVSPTTGWSGAINSNDLTGGMFVWTGKVLEQNPIRK